MAGEWMNNVAVYLLDFINYGIGIIVILIIYQAWKFITFGSGGDEATLGEAAEKVKTFKKDYGKLRRALKKEYRFDQKQLKLVDELEVAVRNNNSGKEAEVVKKIRTMLEDQEKFDALINEVLEGVPSTTLTQRLEALQNTVRIQLGQDIPNKLKEIKLATTPSDALDIVNQLKDIFSKLRTNILGIEALIDKIK